MTGPGRPPIGGPVTFRLDDQRREACELLAAERGQKLADVLRTAVDYYIEGISASSIDTEDNGSA